MMSKRVYLYPNKLDRDILRKFSGAYILKPNLFTTITADKGATTTLWRITYITDPPIHQPWSR